MKKKYLIAIEVEFAKGEDPDKQFDNLVSYTNHVLTKADELDPYRITDTTLYKSIGDAIGDINGTVAGTPPQITVICTNDFPHEAMFNEEAAQMRREQLQKEFDAKNGWGDDGMPIPDWKGGLRTRVYIHNHNVSLVMPEPHIPSPHELAVAFINALCQWLDSDKIAEVVRLNSEDADKSSCHSHDFCDANQAMINALARFSLDFCGQDEAQCSLINKAWDLAKAAKFDVNNVKEKP